MLWFYPNHRTIDQWKKNANGDWTALFAKWKRKMGQGIGMVTSRGTTTYKTLSTPKTYDVPDQYSDQIRLRREWDEKMEHLSEKYNLDYYSSLEFNSDFEQEHIYETLI